LQQKEEIRYLVHFFFPKKKVEQDIVLMYMYPEIMWNNMNRTNIAVSKESQQIELKTIKRLS